MSGRDGTRYRVVIDCDLGRDDALAILAALGSSRLHVDFVTTVAGNVPVDTGTANAVHVLDVAGMNGVPVYQGADAPLDRPYRTAAPPDADMASGERGPSGAAGPVDSAHHALAEWCRELSEIPKRLIAIGPLTNLGRLLREDEQALAGVDEVFVMGGTVGQVETRVSPTAEFNFYSDPEAADLLLRSGMAVRLYDYDVTTSCQIAVESVPVIAESIGPPVGGHVRDWLEHLWEHSNRVYGREGIAVHDLYAVAGAAGIEPERWEWYEMSVDRTAKRRGTIDSRPAQPGHGVAVARGIDPGRWRTS